MSEPNMLDPTPELPDDTPISDVEFPARIRNVLTAAGLKTIGEVREISDDTLLSFQDIGKTSVAHLRETLGLPSTDGVRSLGKKAHLICRIFNQRFPILGEIAVARIPRLRKMPIGPERQQCKTSRLSKCTAGLSE